MRLTRSPIVSLAILMVITWAFFALIFRSSNLCNTPWRVNSAVKLTR